MSLASYNSRGAGLRDVATTSRHPPWAPIVPAPALEPPEEIRPLETDGPRDEVIGSIGNVAILLGTIPRGGSRRGAGAESNVTIYRLSRVSLFLDSSRSAASLRRIKEESVAIPEMVGKIRSVFGLTVLQIAGFVGVSRATIHNHMSGAVAGDSSKYRRLYEMAVEVDEKVKMPLKDGLKSVLIDGRTLLNHLRKWNIYPDQENPLRDQVVQAAELVAKYLKENGPPKYPKMTIHEQRRAAAEIGWSG